MSGQQPSTPRPRVVITESLDPLGIERLAQHADVIQLQRDVDPEDHEAVLRTAHAIVTQVHPIGRDLIEAATDLTVVAKHGVGVDHIDIQAATERGVVVVNTPGANARSVAEHTLAMMLSAARRLPALDTAVRTGEFGIRQDLHLADLHGRVVGVVGAGRTGRLVLQLCCGALGMEAITYDAAALNQANLPAGVEIAPTLAPLLQRADFLTVHLPLTPATRGMIGAAELAQLPAGAIVVNVGRGGVVDEAALAAAVRAGALSGAAVDVFVNEPPAPDNPLLHVPGIQLSPHAAGLSRGASQQIASQLSDDVLAVLSGSQPRHPVNR